VPCSETARPEKVSAAIGCASAPAMQTRCLRAQEVPTAG
jgi:hypothetical protein